MAYLNPIDPRFGGFGSFGCGGDCRCRACRSSSRCGGDCRCSRCRSSCSGLGERYEEDDDDDEPTPPRRPPGPGRMRTGVAGLGGLGLGAFGVRPGGPVPRVVLVPGIMGSRLIERRTGLTVWGDARMLAAVVSPATAIAWRLAMGSGNGINNGGALVPNGLTRLLSIDPYSSIVADLVAAFGSANVLPFAYDWRLTNEHNAGLLQSAIRARWPDAEQCGDRRVHLIAHSMGGLVSRWLVEQLGGTRMVQTLTTVGTPHIGAPEALTLLATASFGFVPGHRLASLIPGVGILMREVARLAKGFGSLAQLLPGFDYFVPRGATSPESITATFNRIRTSVLWTPIFGGSILRGPATRSIRNLNRVLISNVPALNARLAGAGVRYFHIATTNHDTVVQARGLLGPAITPIRARCGDGTVPGSSAVLPGASHIIPLFRTSSQLHGDLFNDASIRSVCLNIVRGLVPGVVPGPACAGPAPRTGLEGNLGCGGCITGKLQEAGVAESDPLAEPEPLAAPW